ncbi:hypothetical protein EMIT0194MI4_10817 [Pseudomonas sp. IT-194MI4]
MALRQTLNFIYVDINTNDIMSYLCEDCSLDKTNITGSKYRDFHSTLFDFKY